MKTIAQLLRLWSVGCRIWPEGDGCMLGKAFSSKSPIASKRLFGSSLSVDCQSVLHLRTSFPRDLENQMSFSHYAVSTPSFSCNERISKTSQRGGGGWPPPHPAPRIRLWIPPKFNCNLPLSPKSDHHHLSPNNTNTPWREKVIRINEMITNLKRKNALKRKWMEIGVENLYVDMLGLTKQRLISDGTKNRIKKWVFRDYNIWLKLVKI